MTCVCSLAGTAACASCLNNPNSTKQYSNFITWIGSTERTCKVESCLAFSYDFSPEVYYEFKMQCGGSFDWNYEEPPNYCPNCGAKVMGE